MNKKRTVSLTLNQLESRDNPSRPLPFPVIFVGAQSGTPPTVQAIQAETGKQNFEIKVFEKSFTGGVNVAAADFTDDDYPDLVVAAGPNGGPRVRILDGKTGEQIPGPLGNFWAFENNFHGGVKLSAADVNGDDVVDLIAAAGKGGGPRVRVWDGKTGKQIANFFAMDPDFRGGVSIASADFTLDGKADLAVGAGPGGRPDVKIFNLNQSKNKLQPIHEFLAYEKSFKGGVNVGTDWKAGDVDGDQINDLVVAPGPGRSATVKVYSGKSFEKIREFEAFEKGYTAGLQVGTAFVTDDPLADVVVGTMAGVQTEIRVFNAGSSKLVNLPTGKFLPFGANNFQGVNIATTNDPPVDECSCLDLQPGEVFEQTFQGSDAFWSPDQFNTITVEQKVVATSQSYTWTFKVTNTSTDSGLQENLALNGMGRFILHLDDISEVNVLPNSGWGHQIFTYPPPEPDEDGIVPPYIPKGSIDWQGAPIFPGESKTFTFTTPPRTLCDAAGFGMHNQVGPETAYTGFNFMGPGGTEPAGVTAAQKKVFDKYKAGFADVSKEDWDVIIGYVYGVADPQKTGNLFQGYVKKSVQSKTDEPKYTGAITVAVTGLDTTGDQNKWRIPDLQSVANNPFILGEVKAVKDELNGGAMDQIRAFARFISNLNPKGEIWIITTSDTNLSPNARPVTDANTESVGLWRSFGKVKSTCDKNNKWQFEFKVDVAKKLGTGGDKNPLPKETPIVKIEKPT